MKALYPSLIAAVFMFVPTTARTAHAQDRHGLGHIAVAAGPVNYDLSGTGWSWGTGVRGDLPLAGAFTVEGGLTYFQYDSQYATEESYLFPEVGAHLVAPTRFVRPYVFAGPGVAIPVYGGGRVDFAVHGGIGIRTAGQGPYGARIEGRLRNITLDANQSMLELFFGLSHRW